MGKPKVRQWIARAVEPSAGLKRARYPILATEDTNSVSPLPLGIAIRILEDGKHPRALPMYFVSERASLSRKIPSGWYIAGEIGQHFDLVVSNVHRKGKEHFWGTKLEDKNVIAHAEVMIDGENPTGRFFSPISGYSNVCTGFVVQRTDDLETERPFRFSEALVGEDEETEATEDMGCIELRISRGFLDDDPDVVEAESDNKRELKSTSAVSAKSAAMRGITVRVAADKAGERLKPSQAREPVVCTTAELLSTIKVHIRQKAWLQSKNIIDIDGSAWRPSKQGNKKSSEGIGGVKKRKREEVEIAITSKKATKEEAVVSGVKKSKREELEIAIPSKKTKKEESIVIELVS